MCLWLHSLCSTYIINIIIYAIILLFFLDAHVVSEISKHWLLAVKLKNIFSFNLMKTLVLLKTPIFEGMCLQKNCIICEIELLHSFFYTIRFLIYCTIWFILKFFVNVVSQSIMVTLLATAGKSRVQSSHKRLSFLAFYQEVFVLWRHAGFWSHTFKTDIYIRILSYTL